MLSENEKTEFKTAIYSTGMVLIDIKDLSQILGISAQTIAKLASSKNSPILPPRFPTESSSVRWLLKDVWAWLEAKSQTKPPAPGNQETETATPEFKIQAGRGRPNRQVAAAAQAAGLSIKEYREKIQAQAGA